MKKIVFNLMLLMISMSMSAQRITHSQLIHIQNHYKQEKQT